MEVSLALGMRVKWRRLRVVSTRAMLKSMPICPAFSSAPAAAIFAASRERHGRGLVAMMGWDVLYGMGLV